MRTSAQMPRKGHKAAKPSFTRTFPSEWAKSLSSVRISSLDPKQIKIPLSLILTWSMINLEFSTLSYDSNLILPSVVSTSSANSPLMSSVLFAKKNQFFIFRVFGKKIKFFTKFPFYFRIWSFYDTDYIKFLIFNNISILRYFYYNLCWKAINW
jgi:hypothetical protein